MSHKAFSALSRRQQIARLNAARQLADEMHANEAGANQVQQDDHDRRSPLQIEENFVNVAGLPPLGQPHMV